jgi:hypothetical protein
MMANIEAKTCSCWQLCEPPIANKYKLCLTVLLQYCNLINTMGMSHLKEKHELRTGNESSKMKNKLKKQVILC